MWVSWVRSHLIGRENFWVLDPSRRGSWLWRAICKLRPLARPMLRCELGSGAIASFWQDNWTSLGPLIDLVGERGPQVTGLSINAVVADALTADGWWLDRSRSRNPIISFIKDCLPNAQEVLDSEVDDKYVWYPVAEQGTGKFHRVIPGTLYILAQKKYFGIRLSGLPEEFLNMLSFRGWLLGIEWSRETGLSVRA